MASGAVDRHPTTSRIGPVVVTEDQGLLDHVLRLAAAVGVNPEVVHDPSLLHPAWAAAPLVLLGDDLAPAVDARRLGRRGDVLIATRRGADVAVWRVAVKAGADEVLTLPADDGRLRDRLADSADGGRRAGRLVAVLGGCGGAGASLFATVLAASAAREGRRVLLVDADPWGGGLDLALGSEQMEGARWPELVRTSGRVSATSLLQALPTHGTLAVVSCNRHGVQDLPAGVLGGVLAAGRRGCDLVVVDVPRRLDDAGREALAAADGTVLVAPAEVRAVAAATRVATEAAAAARQVGLVVRGPGPAGLDGPLVAASLELPLWAQMRPDRGMVADVDLGRGPWHRPRGPLARACRAVLGVLAADSEGSAA